MNSANAPVMSDLMRAFGRTPFRVENGKLIDWEGAATQYASDDEAMRAGIASYGVRESAVQVAA